MTMLSVVAQDHAFAPVRSVAVDHELTLEEIILGAGLVPDPSSLDAWIGDQLVDPAWWGRTRPKAGQFILLRVRPAGGGRGGGGDKALRTVLGVVVIIAAAVATILTYGAAAAAYPALGTIGAALIAGTAGAAVSIGGSLLINALIPPQSSSANASLPAGDVSRASPTYSLAGARNGLVPYRPVPRVYGTYRITPPYAAEP